MLRASNAIVPVFFCVAWFFCAALAPSPAVADAPRVLSVSPSFAALHDGKEAPTKVVIRANVSLDKATAVMWGNQSVPKSGFTVQHDGSIITNACCTFKSASTFPVTVVMDGHMLPSDATFSVPVGEADILVPDPYNGADPRYSSYWGAQNGRIFTLGPGLTYSLGPGGDLLFIDPNQAALYVTTAVQKNVAATTGTDPKSGSFFGVIVECAIGNAQSGAINKGDNRCKNWDGQEGVFVARDGKCAPEMSVPGFKGKITEGEGPVLSLWDQDLIKFDLSSCFDPENLVRTFTYGIQPFATQPGTKNTELQLLASGQPASMSSTFNVVVAPAAVLQVNAIPYTIVYQPPGDQSTVNFTTTKTYSTQFSIAGSNSIDNKSTTTQSSSTNFAADAAFFLGVTLGSGSQDTNTVMKDFGTVQGGGPQGMSSVAFGQSWSTVADPNLVPGNGAVCTSTTSVICSGTTQTANLYALEPFWNDLYVLVMHPQFAVWVLGGAADRYMMYGAVPVLGEITVAQLDACATGVTTSWGVIDPCKIQYADSVLTPSSNDAAIIARAKQEVFKLSARDAKALLALDPFYGRGQNADIDVSTRADLIASTTYGAMAGTPASPYMQTLSNTTQTQNNKNSQLAYSSDISQMTGTTSSYGLTFKVSTGGGGGGGGGGGTTAGADESLTVGSSDQTTSEQDLKLTYQSSTAVSKQKVTTASVTLNDIANCTPSAPCHGPLPARPSANIFFDRVFGSFMFQDPGAPKGYSRDKAPACCNMLIHSLIQQEAAHPRFADVSRTDQAAGVIGLLALAGVLPGDGNGNFKPNATLTREQLAVAMAQAAHLRQPAQPTRFSDVSPSGSDAGLIAAATAKNIVSPRSAREFGPDDPVTTADLTAALGRAGFTTAANANPAKSTGSVTRAQAAVLIFAVLPAR
jgi:hypothetical protein